MLSISRFVQFVSTMLPTAQTLISAVEGLNYLATANAREPYDKEVMLRDGDGILNQRRDGKCAVTAAGVAPSVLSFVGSDAPGPPISSPPPSLL